MEAWKPTSKGMVETAAPPKKQKWESLLWLFIPSRLWSYSLVLFTSMLNLPSLLSPLSMQNYAKSTSLEFQIDTTVNHHEGWGLLLFSMFAFKVLRIETKTFTLSYDFNFLFYFLFWIIFSLSCPRWAQNCNLSALGPRVLGLAMYIHHTRLCAVSQIVSFFVSYYFIRWLDDLSLGVLFILFLCFYFIHHKILPFKYHEVFKVL